jgi:hypothetical protein
MIKYTKTAILPVTLYECETCSVTLKEENILRVSENREYLDLRNKAGNLSS